MTPDEYAQNLQDELTKIENQHTQPLIITAHQNHQNLTATLAAITALGTLTPRHTRQKQKQTALTTYTATLATIQTATNQAAQNAATLAAQTTHHHLQNYTTQTFPQHAPPKPQKIQITNLKTKITQIATTIALGINLATQNASRQTTQNAITNNQIKTTGWQWVAQLDKKTCRSCIAHHGEIHKTGQLHSHPNCRCTMAPLLSQNPDITPSVTGREWFDELDFDSQVEAIAGVASSPRGMEIVRGLADGSLDWSDLSRRARWYDGSMYWTQRNLTDILARRT